ncbi:TPA: YdcF family protein [Clostridium perfringens]|uniref:YdcF family protein n=1 Tax=Clostridium perfringens TaxID=1502 RepID=UPI002A209A0C|nr:YdcF family protein [Clostridium perfringens]MDM0917016.1 YdcF family protein [Clostridium perfringens]
MKEKTAEYINVLGKFCGKRDIPSLRKEELKKKYDIDQADVMVLFGGSILCGGDLLAEAIKNNIAKKYVIVGGAGHTTEVLRKKMHSQLPNVDTSDLTEAEIFDKYLKYKYNLKADLLECNSTNCGNNITYLLELLKENNIQFNSIIIMQDATMQHRMEAGLRKYVSSDIKIINFATYHAKVILKDGKLAYENDILGMWDINHYITLLMGEIPRLSDNSDGYGPKGKDFIAHVSISDEVNLAFSELKKEFSGMVRTANPLYASKN